MRCGKVSLPFRDLVFPHHENELAQSRAAVGGCGCGQDHDATAHTATPGSSSDEFVRYWVHNGEGAGRLGRIFHPSHGLLAFPGYELGGTLRQCPALSAFLWSSHDDGGHRHPDPGIHRIVRSAAAGFVNVDSEKMSKSLGNFFTIREVLKQYHPAALRWFLVNTQYRQPVNYTQRALEEASGPEAVQNHRYGLSLLHHGTPNFSSIHGSLQCTPRQMDHPACAPAHSINKFGCINYAHAG